jgi:hypothetical protein
MHVVGGLSVNAAAFVVGPRDGAGAALEELARGLGFAPVGRYAGLAQAEAQAAETPLLFFLCAEVRDVGTLKPVADAIRFSGNLNVKFSPLIYVARDLSVEGIKLCIRMGFDDVIALPYAGGLAERIGRQVGQPQVYYETASYFGPDRRNRVGESRSTESDHGGGQYRRIEIVRHPRTGVDVVHDDFQVVL